MRFFPKDTLALLTDFGDRDWYVAAMKAVALSIDASLPIVDICHTINPGDIRSAAFILSQCWREFPTGTVFVVVVDPGVGTDRPPIALEADGRFFVGPDNGLFGWLGNAVIQCHDITNATLFRECVSHTFHGRDIFAPVGARLAAGLANLDQVGPAHPQLDPTDWPIPSYESKSAYGQILYIDHYGNAITNLHERELSPRYDLAEMVVSLHPRHVVIGRTFGDVPHGQPVAYIGSGGHLEIAVNGGCAKTLLDLRLDQHIELLPR
ncbi:MAG: SAM-dependent chlorinase/fluorinase [Verrucomicrobiota bacterium]